MKVEITASKVKGSIRIPSSKSDAHRALVCASLASNQTSVISNIDFNDDINATLDAIQELGAKVIKEGNKVIVTGSPLLRKENLCFDANESGSTLRFLIPLFAHFSNTAIVKGSKRLLERPLNIYKGIMNEGLLLNDNHLVLNHKFISGDYLIEGNVSSQFISGLLFLLPLLENDSLIEVLPPFESKSYVYMTIDIMNKFGVKVELINNFIKIQGKQTYKALNYQVEGDYSQAAFFASLGVLNGEIKCEGLKENSLQGDKVILDILRSMGGSITKEDLNIKCLKSSLNGTTIDLANCPDLGPILMCVAAKSKGITHFINASRLRLKESDRIGCMEKELVKFGVKITSNENEIWVEGNSELKAPINEIDAHNDHRIAMSLSVLMTSLKEGKMVLLGGECINKSYPNFYKDLACVGGKVVCLHD